MPRSWMNHYPKLQKISFTYRKPNYVAESSSSSNILKLNHLYTCDPLGHILYNDEDEPNNNVEMQH
jgi:hypothetical protein